jgi:histone deacetylase 6
VFIGIGEPYSGVVHLAGHRDLRARADAILAFIDDYPLKAISLVMDEYLADWYYHSALVFTSHQHPAFDTNINPKRPRRKFGRVIRSDSVGLYNIIEERFEESMEFLEDDSD